MIVLSLDPGTGVSSPTGLSIFDVDTRSIIHAENITTKLKPLEHRLKDISDQVSDLINLLDLEDPKKTVICCIESFVMRGKGGETLQRLIGSFMSRIPYHWQLFSVQNTTIKLFVAGHGRAEKQQVAQGVLHYFEQNKSSVELIKCLIKENEWDILDSLAIGITGWEKNKCTLPQRKPKKPKQ